MNCCLLGEEKRVLEIPVLTGDSMFVAVPDDRYTWDCIFPNHGAAQSYRLDEGLLPVHDDAILERYESVGDKQLVLLDPKVLGVREAVEALSREQFSSQMYHRDYVNAEKTVNFPLTVEKLTSFSRIPGMQLVGVLDSGSNLCGFACFFVGEWPEFAGELKMEADRFASNWDPKTYLYLVLIRPEAKGQGVFTALYDQVGRASIAVGNVGCAIEIHQINAPSSAAHTKDEVGFVWMGTTATHEREDTTGVKFPLKYRQYYRSYSSLPLTGSSSMLPL